SLTVWIKQFFPFAIHLLSGGGTSEMNRSFGSEPPCGASRPDAVAKYTECRSSDLRDGCISLSSAEGLVSGVSACYFMPVSGLFPFLWFLTFKVFFILFTGSCLQISHFCVNKLL